MLQQNASPFIPILVHTFQLGYKISSDIFTLLLLCWRHLQIWLYRQHVHIYFLNGKFIYLRLIEMNEPFLFVQKILFHLSDIFKGIFSTPLRINCVVFKMVTNVFYSCYILYSCAIKIQKLLSFSPYYFIMYFKNKSSTSFVLTHYNRVTKC